MSRWIPESSDIIADANARANICVAQLQMLYLARHAVKCPKDRHACTTFLVEPLKERIEEQSRRLLPYENSN